MPRLILAVITAVTLTAALPGSSGAAPAAANPAKPDRKNHKPAAYSVYIHYRAAAAWTERYYGMYPTEAEARRVAAGLNRQLARQGDRATVRRAGW